MRYKLESLIHLGGFEFLNVPVEASVSLGADRWEAFFVAMPALD